MYIFFRVFEQEISFKMQETDQEIEYYPPTNQGQPVTLNGQMHTNLEVETVDIQFDSTDVQVRSVSSRIRDIKNSAQFLLDGLYTNSRKGFIRKVYTLVSLQLLFTVMVSIVAMNVHAFQEIFVSYDVFLFISLLLIGLSLAVFCCYEQLKGYGLPILIIWTALESILVGIICSLYPANLVLTALGITAIIVVSLTIYACTTKTDFTGLGPYLFVFCIALFCFGISLFFWMNSLAYLLYCCLGCFLFSVYLIYDTQLIIGKFNTSYSFDQAYFAALMLYLDIVRIFVYILRILNAFRR